METNNKKVGRSFVDLVPNMSIRPKNELIKFKLNTSIEYKSNRNKTN